MDESQPSTSKTEAENKDPYPEVEEIKYFQCALCELQESYEYFGKEPPFVRQYKLLEDSYVLEDPFAPPKQGEFLVLGAHCIICGKSVCKSTNCSFYFDGTYCIHCAKNNARQFPKYVQEKLNKIIVN